MEDAVVYLVPVGHDRYELYSEPPDEPVGAASDDDGFMRRRLHRLRERWRETVQTARHRPPPTGAMGRMRHWIVCRVAETIAEQRTLWSLRLFTSVELQYPSDISEERAIAFERRLLARASRHHGLLTLVDGVLFALSGLLVFVPGPNVLAYYFGLRLAAHVLSWRGARQGLDRVEWRARPESALAELGALARLPRDSRAARVEAIASALKLPRLAAFFDRVAV